jgi:DNA-binding LytR/AlgR family response regulator
MKLKCVIIDDEPIARKIIQEFVEDIEFLELVAQAENPLKATELLANNDIDVLFLDINMPKINGIDFLKSMKPTAAVIMTTAYPEHALEAFDLDVVDYLIKPIPFERFLKACHKAKEIVEYRKQSSAKSQTTHDHFFIKCENRIEKVLYDELLYVEAMANYVKLHTTSKKMIVYMTVKSLENQLPGNKFVKVHKSFIVNADKVISIDGNVLDLGIAQITISQNLREKVLQEILKDKVIKR